VDAATLAGRLRLAPGQAATIDGGRPVVSPWVMQRLTEGLDAALLPQRLSMLFSLCGTAHRITARRAVAAAMLDGGSEPPDGAAAREAWDSEDQLLALWTAREHLQRIALDLPSRLPVAGVPADAGWLAGQPLAALPADAAAADAGALQAQRQALLPWLENALLGGPAADWCPAFEADAAGDDQALLRWSARAATPAQRWLHGAAAAGHALALPCRALPADVLEPAGLRALAERLDTDAGFPSRPTWQGEPAETGCWTRSGLPAGTRRPHNAWMRWQYRIAELVSLARADGPPVLRSGTLSLGGGRGIAWTEMSRGLLVYAVALARRSAGWTVERCRVLAPTEWNFHPAGGLARALRPAGLAADAVRAAVVALDPCVDFALQPAAGAADA
jgi:hypothetical protein